MDHDIGRETVMLLRKMRIMLLAVLVLALLAGCMTAAGAEELRPIQRINEEGFVSLLRKFAGEVDYTWGPWQFQTLLLNGVSLSGDVNDEGIVTSVSGESDPEHEETLTALKETLRLLYESDQTPAIEELMDAGEEADMDVEFGKLHLEAGMFTLNYWSDWFLPMRADDLAQFLTEAGLLEGDLGIYRSVTLGNNDCRARMQTDEQGKLSSLHLYYYGEDAESGKAFFSEMSRELLEGQDADTALQLIGGQYDGLEVGKKAVEKLDGLRLTLNRTKNYYRLYFNINTIPWNAAAFSDSFGEMAAAAAAEPATDPEAFAGIDTDAQAAEQVIFRGNGVTVTMRGLVYGRTEGGVDAIGLKLLVEKEEGVLLDRIAFPVSDVNRWKGDFRFFDKSMYYPKGTSACSEETTAWWKLDDLKENIPGFDGISSFRIGVNLIPPEGQGETVRGETVELTTGLPERPLPGKALYSDDHLTVNLTGVGESSDRWFVLGLAGENRGSDKTALGPYRGNAYVNDFQVYRCMMDMEIPAGLRMQGRLTLDREELQKLGITDLSQVDTLRIVLAEYITSENRLGDILITREDLGLQQADAAEPAPETVLYDRDGVKLVFTGLGADGRSLDMTLRNESGDRAILGVRPVAANGWQINLGGWDFTAKAGESSRQLIPVADLIPDFTEFSDIRLQVYPCKRNAELGFNEPQYDLAQETELTFGPAAQHEDRGSVLAEYQGVTTLRWGISYR